MNELLSYLEPWQTVVLIGFFWSLLIYLESKRVSRKQAKCHHKDLEKIGESTTYDMQLNPTSTVRLKCLSCEKIFEVKK